MSIGQSDTSKKLDATAATLAARSAQREHAVVSHSATAHPVMTADRPLLVPIPEACRQFGGIKKTAFYGLAKRHDIKLVRVGGRSMCLTSEIERVVAELMADCGAADQAERARDLASKSVKARRARRGSST